MVNECVTAGYPNGPSQQVSLLETLSVQRSGQGRSRDFKLESNRQLRKHFTADCFDADTALASSFVINAF